MANSNLKLVSAPGGGEQFFEPLRAYLEFRRDTPQQHRLVASDSGSCLIRVRQEVAEEAEE